MPVKVTIFNWPFLQSNDLLMQGLGFWFNVVGLLITLVGFGLTWRQLKKTTSAAEAAKREANRIEVTLKRYDAAQEISQAHYALRTAKRHFSNRAWSDGGESYEDVRRSLLSLKANIEILDLDTSKSIDRIASYISKFCERIDRGDFDTASVDDFAKAKSTLRDHEQFLMEIGIKLQKGVF